MVRSMYYREQPIIVPLHTSVCLIDSSIIRKLCMVAWCRGRRRLAGDKTGCMDAWLSIRAAYASKARHP